MNGARHFERRERDRAVDSRNVRISAGLDETPSFSAARLTSTATVPVESPRSYAMSLFEWPIATHATT